MAANLKAVDLLKRPPLTDIKSRLHVFADEIDGNERAVIVLTIPDCSTYNFGDALSHAEAAGYLLAAANWHTGFRDD